MGSSTSSLGFYVSLAIFAFALVGCDADGKECAAGSKESNWAACNRSCSDKDNKDSCARAKKIAAEVCADSDNDSACEAGCKDGDKKSCEKAKALQDKYESARPKSSAPKK
jgi:hypothetical protein